MNITLDNNNSDSSESINNRIDVDWHWCSSKSLHQFNDNANDDNDDYYDNDQLTLDEDSYDAFLVDFFN